MNVELLKKSLMKSKMVLEKRLDNIQNDKLRKKGAISADFAEQAVDVENDEVIDGLESIELNELKKVNAALERMKNGSYGICISCGREIEAKRLEAIAYSSQCLECAN